MALPSQVSPTGLRGRRMASRRRRHSARWLWVLLALAVIGLVLYLFLWPDADPPAGNAAADAAQRSPGAPGDAAGRPAAAMAASQVGTAPPGPAHGAGTPAPGRQGRETADMAQPPTTPADRPADPAPPTHPPATAAALAARLEEGRRLVRDGHLVGGRRVLSQLLAEEAGRLAATDDDSVRQMLRDVNQTLFFSTVVVPGDPLATTYTVESGDVLARVAARFAVTDQLIALVNGIRDPNRVRVGQELKVPQGPFHALVAKSAFRLEVYGRGSDGAAHFVADFPVGLGEGDSTPPGRWIVQPGRKLIDPPWHNPRTGQFFAADDPRNPIGERWIGLKGSDERTRDMQGYGIHGTIEPQSIGQMRSMGCVRMLAQDVELVYMLLVDGRSTVEIRP